jgi:hypothetical protein
LNGSHHQSAKILSLIARSSRINENGGVSVAKTKRIKHQWHPVRVFRLVSAD